MKRLCVYVIAASLVGGVLEWWLIVERMPLHETFAEAIVGLLSIVCVHFFVVSAIATVLSTSIFLAGVARRRCFPSKVTQSTVMAVVLVYFIIVTSSVARLPVLTAGETTPLPRSVRPKSVLFLVVDTLRQDHLGCYGHPLIKTPAADFLARKSVQYSQVLCQIPITAPSHASMFSGLYPYAHGCRYNGVPSRQVPVLPDELSNKGYVTAAVVSSAAVKSTSTGLNRGFRVYEEAFQPGRFFHRPMASFPGRTLDFLWSQRVPERTCRETNRIARAMLERLYSPAQKAPFFLWVHYYDPHMPYRPAEPFGIMYANDFHGEYPADFDTAIGLRKGTLTASTGDLGFIVSQYMGEVSAADRAIEELLRDVASLRLSGSHDDVLIILTSDHGESLTEHDYFFYHGEKLYDPSLLVPLLITSAADLRAPVSGTRIDSGLALLLDLPATIVGMTGCDVPHRAGHGRNLQWGHDEQGERLSLAENGTFFFLGGENHELHLEKKSFSLRDEDWKYIREPEGGELLFNLASDPAELLPSRDEQTMTLFRDRLTALMPDLTGETDDRIILDRRTREALEALGYIYEQDH